MRCYVRLSTTLLIAALTAFAGTVRAVDIPDEYLVGTMPAALAGKIQQATTPAAPKNSQATESGASFERPAHETDPTETPLDGSFYSQVFPVYHTGTTISYVRMGNNSNAATTFHVLVAGSPTGRNYGEADYSIPAHAAPQYSITEILSAAGAAALNGGDTAYSLYLANDDDQSFFQHVIFNSVTSFFEDLTICVPGASIQGDKTVTTVHTTRLASFPSTVYIHNLLAIPASYRVVVRSARDGTVVGNIASLSVAANATYSMPMSFFQTQAGWSPTSTQLHANLEFHATAAFEATLGAGPDPADLGAIFGQTVVVSAYNGVVNMSNKCRMVR